MSNRNFVAPPCATQQPAIAVNNDAAIAGFTGERHTTDRMCDNLDTVEDNGSDTTEPSPHIVEVVAEAQKRDTGDSDDDTEVIDFEREVTENADMRMVLYKGGPQTQFVGFLGEQRLVSHEQAAQDTQTSPKEPYSLENLLRKVFVGHSKSLPTTQQIFHQ